MLIAALPKVLKGLVDLDGFEPSTSSMPFKKYQSLTGISTRNKRLSTRLGGRRWTPRGCFWASGLHADARTPRRRLAPGVPSRAVVAAFKCCLLETTTIRFLIRMMPMWKSGRAHRGRDVEVRPGNPNSGWSAVDVTSQAGFLAGRPSSPGNAPGEGGASSMTR